MKLTVVGSAPAYTLRAGRSSSCYLLEAGDSALLLDLGQGSFSELARYRRPETLDGVLISHLHADHLVDLVPLRHYVRYEAEVPGEVKLHGPRDLRRRFDAFQGERGFLDALPGEPLGPMSFSVGRFVVEAAHVTHIPDSFAFRVTDQAAAGSPGLVYSGDCANHEDLLPLIRPGDSLLCEAAFGTDDAAQGIHLTARQAAQAAAAGGAAHLFLTHILDQHDEAASRSAAAAAFEGEVRVAVPGLSLEVGAA